MPPLRTLKRPVLIFLVLGLTAEMLIVLASTALLDLSGGREARAQALVDGDVLWTVAVRRAAGGARHTSTRERGVAWSPHRAVGPPDTPAAGDFHTAWASATADGSDEWLELEFAEPVATVEVRAYESFNPGAIASVSVFDERGREFAIAQAVTDRAPGPGVNVAKFVVPGGGSVRTRRVKLYVDSVAVRGWNEIDAVGLVDGAGNVHWATAARASSWYGSHAVMNGSLPPWASPRYADLHVPREPFASAAATREDRVIEARGWPLPAFWGEVKLRPEDRAVTDRALPLRPIWFNLLLDAAMLGAALWLGRLALTRPARFLAESTRARRGACIRCGYDLQFDLKHGCPECGWRR
jgi:hypothetical protein